MSDVSFRIRVQGGRESQQDVLAVRQALAGVRSDLDSASAASRIFGKSQEELSAAEKRTVLEMSAATAPTVNWGEATGRAGEQSERLGAGATHATRLLGELASALGINTPLMAEMERGAVGATRGLGEFGLAATGAGIAVLGLAAVAGRYVEDANKLTAAQAEANRAVGTLDVSGARGALSSLSREVDLYAERVRITSDEGASRWQQLGALVGAFGTSVEGLTQRMRVTGEASHQTWESFGRGGEILKTTKAEAEASAVSFGLMASRASSIDALATALEGQAEATRRAALASVDEAANQDRAYEAAARRIIKQEEDLGNLDTARRLSADLEDEMAQRGLQRVAQREQAEARYGEQIQANALRIAEARGQQIEMESRLESAIVRRAQIALGAAQQEADASLAAARADAQFFGTSLQGLQNYQAERRARIQAQGQLEIADIQQRAAADRAALTERMAAVPQYGAEWQRLNAQLKAQDQETQNAIQTKSAETANKLRTDANATTEERRANYARELALADSHYRQLEALGQGDVAARIAQLEQVARDENASFETRSGAAREAYSARRQLENELFGLVKANGLVTERDAVAHAAAVAASWKQGSSQRLQAEAQFADQVRALWSGLAQTGGGAMAAIANVLKERFGIVNATLAEQQQFWPQLVAEAQQYLGMWQSGGYVTEEMKRQITAVADVQARLTQEGVTFGQQAGVYFQDLANKLSGTLTPAGELVNQMDRLGIETGQARTVAEQMAGELASAFGEAGQGLSGSFRRAFEEIESSAQEFLGRLRQTLSSGLGPVAEDFARTVIRAVTQSLDEAAARS